MDRPPRYEPKQKCWDQCKTPAKKSKVSEFITWPHIDLWWDKRSVGSRSQRLNWILHFFNSFVMFFNNGKQCLGASICVTVKTVNKGHPRDSNGLHRQVFFTWRFIKEGFLNMTFIYRMVFIWRGPLTLVWLFIFVSLTYFRLVWFF